MTINKKHTISLQNLYWEEFLSVEFADDGVEINVGKDFTFPPTDVMIGLTKEQAVALAKAILEITGE